MVSTLMASTGSRAMVIKCVQKMKNQITFQQIALWRRPAIWRDHDSVSLPKDRPIRRDRRPEILSKVKRTQALANHSEFQSI